MLMAVGATAYVVKDFTGAIIQTPGDAGKGNKDRELALKAKADQIELSDNAPGEKALLKAQRLIAQGAILEAEEKLKYVSSYYPTAKAATRARKILGEINLDRLLDPNIKEGKAEVIVERGDNYSQIISKHKTTMDSLVHFSRLKRADSASLQPGDKLTIMPLEMRVVISVRRKTLTVYNGDTYVKEYPILKSTYKGTDAMELSISSIRGIEGGKSFPSHSSRYLAADKIFNLSDKSLVIRSDVEDAEDDFSVGFSLASADIAELPLLLRPGNEVTIKR